MIKEVADVTFYEINKDGNPAKPVLFLDTLKVSTVEQTAETTETRGGKGNAKLISWDYNKEINVTLEDALFSPKSMQIMFGNSGAKNDKPSTKTLLKTIVVNNDKVTVSGEALVAPTQWLDARGVPQDISSPSIFKEDGTLCSSANDISGYEGKYFVSFQYTTVNATVIEISADKFPGTYYITGDTYARSETTGKDDYFQFIIPKAKVTAENTITLEAEGDPSVFNLNLTVLRPADGKMMKLVQYALNEGNGDNEVTAQLFNYGKLVPTPSED